MMDSAVGKIDWIGCEVFVLHDAGVVDDDVERGEVGGNFCGEGFDRGRIFDVEREGLHAGIGGDRLVEHGLTAACDNDLVALLVEGFSEAAADAGSAAGDEDGVSAGIHGVLLIGGSTEIG